MLYSFSDFTLDTERRELRQGAETISVAPQVFDLLSYLIRNRQRVVSKDELIAGVWNGRIVSDAALTTRINGARCAVGDTGEKQDLIKTLPRKGFRFVGAVQEAGSSAIATGSVERTGDTPPRLSIVVRQPSGAPPNRMPAMRRSRPARYVGSSLLAKVTSR